MLGVLLTMTTYGTWLRGDCRGWVDDGTIMPADPRLEAHDRATLKHDPFRFSDGKQLLVGEFIGASLHDRLALPIYALSVQSWHIHLVTGIPSVPIPDVVKCVKDSVRYGLRPGRPIWTEGYDKRYCFDARALSQRIQYVERHNLERGWPARPWSFIVDPPWDWTVHDHGK